jgi:hypothetical protein
MSRLPAVFETINQYDKFDEVRRYPFRKSWTLASRNVFWRTSVRLWSGEDPPVNSLSAEVRYKTSPHRSDTLKTLNFVDQVSQEILAFPAVSAQISRLDRNGRC